MTNTITAHFADGTTVTRRTEAAYTHASRKGETVRFHTSHAAAKRAAGAYGSVVETDYAGPVAAVEPTITYAVVDATDTEVYRRTFTRAEFDKVGPVRAIVEAREAGVDTTGCRIRKVDA